MDAIEIEGTGDKPKVILDKSKGVFLIAERSLPEDAVSFYTPIFDWINEYAKNPNPVTDFKFTLEYFNTASSKQIFKLLSQLEAVSKVSDLTVLWYYDKEDKDMLSVGERYAKLVNVKFSLLENS